MLDIVSWTINSLPDDKTLNCSKFKVFADDKNKREQETKKGGEGIV